MPDSNKTLEPGPEGQVPEDRRGRIARVRDALLTGREDPTALGLLRIALVSVFLAGLLAHVGAVAEYFSAASPVGGRFAREAFSERWSLFFLIDDPWAVRAIFGVGALAHVLWLVGLFTPIAGIVSAVVWLSLLGRNPLLYSLPDQLHSALIAWLALMPAGRGLSLDARWRGKGGPVPVWCRRIVQLQLAVMYTTTGLAKSGATWKAEGTAIYYSLVNPYNRHFDVAPALAAIHPYVLRPLTWVVLVWEVAFGGFVLAHWLRERWRRVPDLRIVFLGFGAAMHLGIQAMLYVAWFTPLTLASYLAFLSPVEARALLDRVARRRG